MTYIWHDAGNSVEVLNPTTLEVASDLGNTDGDWGVIVGEDLGGIATMLYGSPEDLIAYFEHAIAAVKEAVEDEENIDSAEPLTDPERDELARLRAAFEENGGRGVEIAERIDALAAREDI